MCITLFFTFLSGPHCTTTSWNFLISRFMEDGNTWQRFFLSICKLRYSPLEFNYWKIANIWQIWIVAIRAMKFDSARIHFFWVTFSLPFPLSLLKLPNMSLGTLGSSSFLLLSMDTVNTNPGGGGGVARPILWNSLLDQLRQSKWKSIFNLF